MPMPKSWHAFAWKVYCDVNDKGQWVQVIGGICTVLLVLALLLWQIGALAIAFVLVAIVAFLVYNMCTHKCTPEELKYYAFLAIALTVAALTFFAFSNKEHNGFSFKLIKTGLPLFFSSSPVAGNGVAVDTTSGTWRPAPPPAYYGSCFTGADGYGDEVDGVLTNKNRNAEIYKWASCIAEEQDGGEGTRRDAALAVISEMGNPERMTKTDAEAYWYAQQRA